MEVGKGKYMFGICKVGEKGQIVIPKEAREVFNIKAGDSLILFGDVKKGLALVKADVVAGVADNVLGESND
ncbi:MAG: AbrB/MazE/SpoVT family DNA-binding domain-containing protein [Clostridia bacterium]|nr:AbrB/MazE/SpoVT family DNA-binding domain-containing protein [Clostridia bacterium]